MINYSPTPQEIAAEARAALQQGPIESSHEHFTRLVRLGWINARGQVTKFLGGAADPEPNYETWQQQEDRPRQGMAS